ncbi:hypothetical protein L1987_05938 [Smallanthus sonchifolius]|uniref:Uncharacterized protein n=1 Tax=Smallanthus sonchifolius TaxID=185202 RepID=A0ACB9JX01_9ASTR|nr:hypothetical protein L1987_05938 [Smallanthus sonchifolius]
MWINVVLIQSESFSRIRVVRMERGEGGGDLNFLPKITQTDASSAKATNFPVAKKLARQLDFNSVGGTTSVTTTTIVPPEYPQRLVVAQMQQPQPRPP